MSFLRQSQPPARALRTQFRVRSTPRRADAQEESETPKECNWFTNLFTGAWALAAGAKSDVGADRSVTTRPPAASLATPEMTLRPEEESLPNVSAVQHVEASADGGGVSLPSDSTVTTYQLNHATPAQRRNVDSNLHKIEDQCQTVWLGNEVLGFKKCSSDSMRILEDVAEKDKVAVLLDMKVKADKTRNFCDDSEAVCAGNLGIQRRDMPQIQKVSAADTADEKIKAALLENLNHYADTEAVQHALRKCGRMELVRPYQDLFLPTLVKAGVRFAAAPTPVRVGQLIAVQEEIKAQKTWGIAAAYVSGAFNSLPQEGITCAVMVPDPDHPPANTDRLDVYVVDGHHRMSGYAVATSGNGYMNCNLMYVPEAQYDDMRSFFERSLSIPGVLRRDLQGNNVRGW